MQQQDGKHTPEKVSAGDLWTIGSVGMALLLGIAVLTVSVVHAADPGPKIGDIVEFPAGRPVSDALQATLALTRAGEAAGQAGGTCDVSVATVAARGGSFVVEQRMPGSTPSYRLHWAGTRTSEGTRDCGRAADLTATPTDVMTLAQAAGGFGVSRKTMVLAGGAPAAAALVN